MRRCNLVQLANNEAVVVAARVKSRTGGGVVGHSRQLVEMCVSRPVAGAGKICAAGDALVAF